MSGVCRVLLGAGHKSKCGNHVQRPARGLGHAGTGSSRVAARDVGPAPNPAP